MPLTAMNYSRKTGFINANKTLTASRKSEKSARSLKHEKKPQNQCLSRSLLRDAVGETCDVSCVNMNILICNDLCQGVLSKNHYKLYSIVSEGIQKEPRSISSRHWPL